MLTSHQLLPARAGACTPQHSSIHQNTRVLRKQPRARTFPYTPQESNHLVEKWPIPAGHETDTSHQEFNVSYNFPFLHFLQNITAQVTPPFIGSSTSGHLLLSRGVVDRTTTPSLYCHREVASGHQKGTSVAVLWLIPFGFSLSNPFAFGESDCEVWVV